MAAPVEKKLFSAIDELLTNSSEKFIEASEILLKFANNILHNVGIEKYRRLRLSNPIIETKLLSVTGAMECLFEMGFEEDGEFLYYPVNKSLDILKKFRDQLQAERDSKLNGRSKKIAGKGLPSLPAPTFVNTAPQTLNAALKTRISVSEQNFFHKLQSNLMHVNTYEDSSLQAKARDLIPLDQFLVTSQEKALHIESTVKNGDKSPDVRDFLLLELLNWFKNSFFKWVDCPDCSICHGVTRRGGMLEPTNEEKRFGANRVEGFFCYSCKKEERFPRYNNPGKLLETRRGRCGEWANCFTLCCRALGFEARYVLDWTDHVWSEVYSQSQSRWLHCDPCENVCDKPLIYEVGWGKKLTYIIAFSKDDVKDVTWRYTRNHEEVLKRRTECREGWLVNSVLKLREKTQSHLDQTRRTLLLNRMIQEMTELLLPKDVKLGEEQGRISGSLSWRLARGEAGITPEKDAYIIKPSESDITNGLLKITYNTAADIYNFSDGKTVRGWQSLANKVENISRKEEQDWRMAYLAVMEGKKSGNIVWKFDLKDRDVRIDEVIVICEGTSFDRGLVTWRLCGKNKCLLLTSGKQLKTNDFSGDKELTLTATLTAGAGSNGWQHAQLFRLKMDDQLQTPFLITLTFK